MSFFSNRSFVTLCAHVATVLFVFTMLAQIMLAAGILPIPMAWGGRQSELTGALRVASLVAVVILGLFMYVIRRRAGLVGETPIPAYIRVGSWVITAFLALNTLGNLASTSLGERLLFGPITFLLTVVCLVVSASRLETEPAPASPVMESIGGHE